MNVKKRPMRYAHSEGHTDVCYSEDGKHILTCGMDGDVRIWIGLEDDDPSSQCVGEQALTVTHKGDHYYVGTDNNNVQAYTFPGSDRDGIISRFTASVTHIAVSGDGKRIVAGSSDMEIHISTIGTAKTTVLSGHKAPILGVALDPKDKYVASSSCDGTVRVWSIDTTQTVKSWDCVPKCNAFLAAKCLGRPSWQPVTGRYLSVPHGKEIRVYERVTWDKVLSFSDDRVQQDFSISAFSPCGNYLAGCTSTGDVCVWNVNLQTCVMNIKHDRGYSICALAWNPSGNGEIAYCDIMGQLGTLEDCIPVQQDSEKPVTQEKLMTVDELIQLNYIDDDDEDGENVISLEKIKAEASQPVFGDDDDKLSHADADDEDEVESKLSATARIVPKCDLQSPFQPSSTPVHLQHRFMVWNSIGIVRCYNTEDENSIDVEFHDTSLHHALHINNFLKHTVATLTEDVLALACEIQDDAPSKVVCVLLNSWDGSKEWSIDLPEGEEALAISAGQGWVAVATDTRNLRIFTVAGTQREVISLPGPVVCLSGHRNKLLAIFHSGMGIPGDQSLGYVVFSVGSGQSQAITAFQPLPVTPKCTLKWAGFSDEGTPFTLDSAGIIRMFSKKGYWLPVCDTQTHCKGKSDHYFVVGISETYQNIRCVLCKGSYYPPTTPRPAVTEISLQIPMCEASTEKSQLEEKFWLSQITSATIDDMCKMGLDAQNDKDMLDRSIKETVIKLFALACRSGLEFRAVELCSLMPSHQVVQLAMKYASKLGKMNLADKIAEVATQKLEENETIVQNDHDIYNSRYSWDTVESPPVLSRRISHEESWNDENPQVNGHSDGSTNSKISAESGSFLLAAKLKKSEANTSEIKPVMSLSQKRLNPFKKSGTKTETGRGLANLTASYQQQQSIKNNKHNSTPEQTPTSQQQTKVKQTTLSTPKPNNSPAAQPPVKKLTFVAWYEKEKEALAEEFPELNDSELSRQGMKRFKELMQNDKLTVHTDSQENSQTDSQPPVLETKKRKMEEESESQDQKPVKKAVTSSSSKLMAFAFKKS
ncbi:WD repeat and HMG-box DNA-binding protein 1 [Periplaneta americana]|uniref:WD repeat and HMG-box DNA-binding protein 1 n=1 Tax=Periplaneta americana TaxID=6978 RepID=UPI0037E884B2